MYNSGDYKNELNDSVTQRSSFPRRAELQPQTYAYDLWCGMSLVARSIALALKSQRFRQDRDALVRVLIDEPGGLALRTLERMRTDSLDDSSFSTGVTKGTTGTAASNAPGAAGASGIPGGEGLASPAGAEARLVVVTFNRCVEYLDDLWDLHPDVLLFDPRVDYELPDAIVRADQGEHYRITPGRATPLGQVDRQILSYLARGLDNKSIGPRMGLQPKTIQNMLTPIYHKLNVKSRNEAILYYWGIEQALMQ